MQILFGPNPGSDPYCILYIKHGSICRLRYKLPDSKDDNKTRQIIEKLPLFAYQISYMTIYCLYFSINAP